MSETKEVAFSINDIKKWGKKKKDDSIQYAIEDKEVFYKDSPVKEEDVKKLNAYSKKYVEDALKTTTVFASDTFKKDEDVLDITYTLPYAEDKVKIIYTKDEDNYSVHTDHEVEHMSYAEELKKRNKALNKAIKDD